MATNLTWHAATLETAAREAHIGQRGAVVWLTRFSGSGKWTIARSLEKRLVERGVVAYVLDGDNLRMGLNQDLSFSEADRAENIRRVAAVAQLFTDAGVVCITAFISPYRDDRARARAAAPPGRFVEVHVATALETCESRDPKGLYRKARAGEIADFTGISAPYEPPEKPEVFLPTEDRPVDDCAETIAAYLLERGFIPEHRAT